MRHVHADLSDLADDCVMLATRSSASGHCLSSHCVDGEWRLALDSQVDHPLAGGTVAAAKAADRYAILCASAQCGQVSRMRAWRRMERVGELWRERLTRRALQAHRSLLAAPARLLLAGAGCVALAVSSDLANTFDAPRHGGPVVALALFLTLALAFACFLAATRMPWPVPLVRLPRAAHWLVYPILLWSLLTGVQTVGILARGLVTSLTTSHVRYGSDDLYYNQYNALLVLRGENPYTGEHLTGEVQYFHERAYTPIARGRFANPQRYPTQAEMDAVVDAYLAHPQTPPPELDPRTTHSYPAGAFLVDVPIVWLGVPSVAFAQILLFVLLAALIVRATPVAWRVPVLLLLLATADGARQVSGGDFEIWPLTLIACAWLARERRWASALLLGAACAIKQTAWLAVPFYLVWVWRERGAAEAGRRALIAAGAFLVVNAPWIVLSPGAWLTSLLLPVSLPLLPDGSGIVGLSLAGLLPLAPSWVYTALEGAAFVGALVWYWRAGPRYPFAGLVLPLVPLLCAWRSSERYFVLLPLAGLLALALTLRADALSGRGVTAVEGER